MQRKPLPSPPKNNAQVQEYTGAVKRGQRGYYVMPLDKGWRVRRADASADSARFETKAAAIVHAKKLVDSDADIVIQGKDGSVTLIELKSA